MTLESCKACGGKVSSEAKNCPACGHPLPKKTSKLTWIIAALIAFAVINAFMAPKTERQTISEETRAHIERQNADDFKRQDAAATAFRIIKASSKNPDSVKIDAIAVNQDASLVCAIFRGTNSFNAVVPGVFVSKAGKHSFNDADVRRECGKDQANFDMKHAIK